MTTFCGFLANFIGMEATRTYPLGPGGNRDAPERARASVRPKQAATCPADDWLELFKLAIDMLAAAERRASGRDRLTLTGMVVYAHATLGEMWVAHGRVTEYLRTDEHPVSPTPDSRPR